MIQWSKTKGIKPASELDYIHYNIHEVIQPVAADELVEVSVYRDDNDLIYAPISFFGYTYNLYPTLWWGDDVRENDILRICFTFPNERVSRNVILPRLRPGDTMIDVGALYGSWTLPAAVMGVNVIAIEPDEKGVDILQQHIRFNKLEKRVSIIKDYAQKNRTNSIDTYVKTLNVDNVRLIKIDTEGTEFDVIEGAKKTINKFKPSLLVELHTQMHGKTPQDELEFITKTYPFYKQHFIFPQKAREQDVEYYHMYHLHQ